MINLSSSPFGLTEHPFWSASTAAGPSRMSFTIKGVGDWSSWSTGSTSPSSTSCHSHRRRAATHRGSRNSTRVLQVTWVTIGASTPRVASRSAVKTAPITTAAATSVRFRVATVTRT